MPWIMNVPTDKLNDFDSMPNFSQNLKNFFSSPFNLECNFNYKKFVNENCKNAREKNVSPNWIGAQIKQITLFHNDMQWMNEWMKPPNSLHQNERKSENEIEDWKTKWFVEWKEWQRENNPPSLTHRYTCWNVFWFVFLFSLMEPIVQHTDIQHTSTTITNGN